MRRTWAYTLLAFAATLGVPHRADAQVSVGVHLFWEWSDGAWQPHRYDRDRRGDYFLPQSGLSISLGYVPTPGYCREWIPGVAPWNQPPPVPCDELFGPYAYARAGVVILGNPGYDRPFVRERFERAPRVRALYRGTERVRERAYGDSRAYRDGANLGGTYRGEMNRGGTYRGETNRGGAYRGGAYRGGTYRGETNRGQAHRQEARRPTRQRGNEGHAQSRGRGRGRGRGGHGRG